MQVWDDKIDVGKLRHRVSIQTYTEAADSFGQMIPTWTTIGTYWALVRNLAGREAFNARQIKATATHQVFMRYTQAIKPEQRLLFGSQTLNIAWVDLVDNRKHKMVLLCEEVVTGS